MNWRAHLGRLFAPTLMPQKCLTTAPWRRKVPISDFEVRISLKWYFYTANHCMHITIDDWWRQQVKRSNRLCTVTRKVWITLWCQEPSIHFQTCTQIVAHSLLSGLRPQRTLQVAWLRQGDETDPIRDGFSKNSPKSKISWMHLQSPGTLRYRSRSTLYM